MHKTDKRKLKEAKTSKILEQIYVRTKNLSEEQIKNLERLMKHRIAPKQLDDVKTYLFASIRHDRHLTFDSALLESNIHPERTEVDYDTFVLHIDRHIKTLPRIAKLSVDYRLTIPNDSIITCWERKIYLHETQNHEDLIYLIDFHKNDVKKQNGYVTYTIKNLKL